MAHNAMTALFEGGNSRLHFAWWDGGAVHGAVHIPYPEQCDGLAVTVETVLGGSVPPAIAACSVSPQYGEPLFDALLDRYGGIVHIVRTAAEAGMTVRYDRPETYGIDRALAASAAYRAVRASCVVVDAGTAVTVDAVDGEGVVYGGYIFPGPETLAHGLASRTGLPLVSLDDPGEGVGAGTVSCIERGIAAGCAAAVGALIESASRAVNADGRVIVTGGWGDYIIRRLTLGVLYRPHLVLEGLGFVSNSFAVRA